MNATMNRQARTVRLAAFVAAVLTTTVLFQSVVSLSTTPAGESLVAKSAPASLTVATAKTRPAVAI